MKISVSVDDMGKFQAAYIKVRSGKSVRTVEGKTPNYYLADYDAKGRLLGVEMLNPGEAEVPDVLVDS